MKSTIFPVSFAFGIAVSLAACSASDDAPMIEENEAVIYEVLDLIDSRNLDEAFELYSADYIYHGPGGQELRGRDGIRSLWEVFLAGFPDLSSTVHDIISQDDKVVLRWSVSGTHTGEFLGVAPTGNAMTVEITEIFRVEDGQLVEAWDQYDRLHLMQQIGQFTD